jgi:signal peptidase II
MFFLIAAAIVLLDQVTKYLIVSTMPLNQSIPLISGFFNLSHINNYGAAFSILQNQKLFLIITVCFVSMVVIFLLIKYRKQGHWLFLTSLAMILGGGIGNLIDRLQYGYVVDFIEFRLIKFPVFNVADISVVCGSILLILYVLLVEPKIASNKEKSYDA